jgi:hypothetical protein
MTDPNPGDLKTYGSGFYNAGNNTLQCQLAVVVICSACRRFLQKAAKKQVEGGWILLNIFPIKQVINCDGILEQSRAKNQVEIELPYRPARLHMLVESIPWNKFLGSLQVLKYRLRNTGRVRKDVFLL